MVIFIFEEKAEHILITRVLKKINKRLLIGRNSLFRKTFKMIQWGKKQKEKAKKKTKNKRNRKKDTVVVVELGINYLLFPKIFLLL